MATININISDSYIDMVLEALKRASGKSIQLSCDLVEPNGKIYYDYKSDEESNLEFSKRAVKNILLGIVQWSESVKEQNRFNLDSKAAQDTVTPITINIPNDILQ